MQVLANRTPYARIAVQDVRGGDAGLLQGALWLAPTTVPRRLDEEWLIQQARKTGAVEDQRMHLFLDQGADYAGTLELVDRGHGNGHFHARRSALNNIQVWTGSEDGWLHRTMWKDHRKEGASAGRLVRLAKTAIAPVQCDPWRIVVRRPHSKSATFEQYKERDLTAKPRPRIRVVRSVEIPKVGPGIYQGAACRGEYIDTVSGTTNQRRVVSRWNWQGKLLRQWDVTAFMLPGATLSEPEGLTYVRVRGVWSRVVLIRFVVRGRRELGAFVVA